MEVITNGTPMNLVTAIILVFNTNRLPATFTATIVREPSKFLSPLAAVSRCWPRVADSADFVIKFAAS